MMQLFTGFGCESECYAIRNNIFLWDGSLNGLSGSSLVNERCDGLKNKSCCFFKQFLLFNKVRKIQLFKNIFF